VSAFWIQHFRTVMITAAVIFTSGLWCLYATHNLVRVLIGMELLTKAVTLLLVLAGAVTGRVAAMQALVITVIVIEVVVLVVAAGIVVAAHEKTGTNLTDSLTDLKG
jgi:multisubunit Na+/H+ antiporter MnhC subunit